MTQNWYAVHWNIIYFSGSLHLHQESKLICQKGFQCSHSSATYAFMQQPQLHNVGGGEEKKML